MKYALILCLLLLPSPIWSSVDEDENAIFVVLDLTGKWSAGPGHAWKLCLKMASVKGDEVKPFTGCWPVKNEILRQILVYQEY